MRLTAGRPRPLCFARPLSSGAAGGQGGSGTAFLFPGAAVANEFLSQLFEGAPDNLFGYFWRLSDKTAHPFPAAAPPDLHGGAADVYLGVSLSSRPPAPSERVRAAEAAGIMALWADVDVAGPAHKKANLPPSFEGALALVAEMPLRATAVVHSGHGLQPWWFLKEPWLFGDDGERARAAAAASGWQSLLSQKARAHSWDVDSTGDLSRVMRLPGTVNGKVVTEPLNVVVMTADYSVRYDPDDFLPFHVARTVPLNGDGKEVEAEEPRYAEVSGLLKASRGARLAFERKLTTGDTSPSGQDMALAIAAAAENWAAPRIAGLLVLCREQNGEDLKHPAYYSLTVNKAVQFVQAERTQDKAVCDLSEFLGQYGPPEANGCPPPPEPDKRRGLIDMLRRITGLDICGLIRHNSSPVAYRLVLGNGQFLLGGVNALCDQNIFRRKLFDFTRRLPPLVKKKQWDTVAQALMDIAEDEETDEEGNHCTAGPCWLRDYIAENPPIDQAEEAIGSSLPFVKDGRTMFFLRNLRLWLKLYRGQDLTVPALSSILRQAGCESTHENYKNGDGKRTSCHLWSIPESSA